MNKALSYLAPYLMLCLAMPLRPGVRLSVLSYAALGVFLAVQLVLGAVCPLAAAKHKGMHYAFPYPSCQDPALKRFDWDLSRLSPAVDQASAVAVNVTNRWIENYIMAYL